jgi:hypothetical protein
VTTRTPRGDTETDADQPPWVTTTISESVFFSPDVAFRPDEKNLVHRVTMSNIVHTASAGTQCRVAEEGSAFGGGDDDDDDESGFLPLKDLQELMALRRYVAEMERVLSPQQQMEAKRLAGIIS